MADTPVIPIGKPKECICIHCGKTFINDKPDSRGQYRKLKVCPDCSRPAAFTTKKCTRCGKSFQVPRDEKTGQFPNLKICNECREKTKPPEYIEYTCQCCGKPFRRYRDPITRCISKNVKYCSEACRDTAYTAVEKESKCKVCGKSIGLQPTDKAKTSVYCSLTCAEADFQADKEAFMASTKSRFCEYQPCEKCGKIFQVEKDANGRWYRRRFCPDCSLSSQMEKIVICKNCGKEFKVGRTSDGRHFVNREVCDKCLEPMKTKTLTCKICGKQFQVERRPNGKFSERKTCLDCDPALKTFVTVRCATCGKEFKHFKDKWGVFSGSKYCSYECSLIQHKYKTCEVCGKKFELERDPKGGFHDNVLYCSDECAKIGWARKTKITCQEKYGVDVPCQIASRSGRISQINIDFSMLLDATGIQYSQEYELEKYSYDFYIPRLNLFLEINPSFTHSVKKTVYKPVTKTYHREKTECAIRNGFNCICIWDWMNKKKLVEELMNADSVIMDDLSLITLHFSRNTNEFVDSNGEENMEEHIKDGWLPVYDDGYSYTFK